MTDDLASSIVGVSLLALAFLGIMFITNTITATTLYDREWSCTETAIISGKAECIKYERKSK